MPPRRGRDRGRGGEEQTRAATRGSSPISCPKNADALPDGARAADRTWPSTCRNTWSRPASSHIERAAAHRQRQARLPGRCRSRRAVAQRRVRRRAASRRDGAAAGRHLGEGAAGPADRGARRFLRAGRALAPGRPADGRDRAHHSARAADRRPVPPPHGRAAGPASTRGRRCRSLVAPGADQDRRRSAGRSSASPAAAATSSTSTNWRSACRQDRPFFGLQLPGVDGRSEPLTRGRGHRGRMQSGDAPGAAGRPLPAGRALLRRPGRVRDGAAARCGRARSRRSLRSWTRRRRARRRPAEHDRRRRTTPTGWPGSAASSREASGQRSRHRLPGPAHAGAGGAPRLCAGAACKRAGLLPPGDGIAQVRGFLKVFVANSKARYRAGSGREAGADRALPRRRGHADYDYSAAEDPEGTAKPGLAGLRRRPVATHEVPGNHITMMSGNARRRARRGALRGISTDRRRHANRRRKTASRQTTTQNRNALHETDSKALRLAAWPCSACRSRPRPSPSASSSPSAAPSPTPATTPPRRATSRPRSTRTGRRTARSRSTCWPAAWGLRPSRRCTS